MKDERLNESEAERSARRRRRIEEMKREKRRAELIQRRVIPVTALALLILAVTAVGMIAGNRREKQGEGSGGRYASAGNGGTENEREISVITMPPEDGEGGLAGNSGDGTLGSGNQGGNSGDGTLGSGNLGDGASGSGAPGGNLGDGTSGSGASGGNLGGGTAGGGNPGGNLGDGTSGSGAPGGNLGDGTSGSRAPGGNLGDGILGSGVPGGNLGDGASGSGAPGGNLGDGISGGGNPGDGASGSGAPGGNPGGETAGNGAPEGNSGVGASGNGNPAGENAGGGISPVSGNGDVVSAAVGAGAGKLTIPAVPEEADGGNDGGESLQPEIYEAVSTASTTGFADSIISEYGVIIDVENGTILAQRNAKSSMSPASMTKVLTVLTAADALGIGGDDWRSSPVLEETFEITIDITDYSFVNGCSNVGFDVGEMVTVRDLFYGTILPSGADAAVGLACYVAGSHEAFVEMMNRKLEELGLSASSHFTNCVGLYDPNHYSTVYDIGVILKTAADNPFCRDVLSAHTYNTGATVQHPEGLLLSNWFLRRIEDKDTHGEVICAKTGYVAQSRSCAASLAADVHGKEYICVTAGSSGSWPCINDHVALYQAWLAGE